MASIYKRSYWATVDGERVKRKTRCYYIKYRDANGKLQRVKAYASKEKTRTKATQLEAEAANGPDPFAEHRKRPITEHLVDFQRSLEANNRCAKHIGQTISRIKALCEGCGFKLFGDVQTLPIEKWLVGQRATDKMGIKTANYYTKGIKQLARWMVRNKRAPENPVSHLKELNPDVDVRVKRRAISQDGFDRLIRAAVQGKPFRGITGPDRAILYLTAANTGLRAGELASLMSSNFDLEGNPPTVAVEASDSKHRERDLVPLRPDLAALLREWIKGRSGRLWPGTWHEKAAKMLYRDLTAARAAWIKEGGPDQEAREKSDFLCKWDENGRRFDFHSLRGQFVTNLARAGVHPRTAQKLARHKTLSLTMENYTHADLADMAGALANLPPVKNWPKNWPTEVDIGGQNTSSAVIMAAAGQNAQEIKNPLQDKGLDAVCHQLSTSVIVRLVGFEPTTCGLKVRCSTS